MWNITGWSGGGRRPLTYNMMPGQFRNTRMSVFSNPTIINNYNSFGNYGSFDYGDCGGCGGSNKAGLFDWLMLGGMGLNFLGDIFTCFWGGGGTKAKTPEVTDTNLKTKAKELADFYSDKDNKIKVLVSDGSITVKINNKVVKTCENYEEFEAFLQSYEFKPEAADPPSASAAAGDAAKIAEANGYIAGVGLTGYTVEYKDNKYHLKSPDGNDVTGSPFSSLEEFKAAANGLKTSTSQVVTSYADIRITQVREVGSSTKPIIPNGNPVITYEQKSDGTNDTSKPPKSIEIKTKGNKKITYSLSQGRTFPYDNEQYPIYIDTISKQEYILVGDELIQPNGLRGFGKAAH